MATPLKERRPDPAPATPVRPVRLGPRDVVVDRRPDGTIHLTLAAPAAALSCENHRAAGTLGRGRARADLSRPARRRGRLAHGHLRAGARSGATHRRGAADARSLAAAAGGDPLRQRHRARAHRPCRHVCRRALRADLAGLCADLAGLRQAPLHLRPAHARPGLRRRRRCLSPRHRDGGASRHTRRRHPQPDPGAADYALRCASRLRGAGGGRCGACESRTRHDRQVPVHLGLDRHAQGGHQHPAHVVLEPGDDPRRSSPISPTSRR